MKTPRAPRINVRKVVDHLNGREGVVTGLKAAGFESVTVKAVDKWMSRGVIPMARWLELIVVARKAGWKLILENYLIRS